MLHWTRSWLFPGQIQRGLRPFSVCKQKQNFFRNNTVRIEVLTNSTKIIGGEKKLIIYLYMHLAFNAGANENFPAKRFQNRKDVTGTTPGCG